jgi:hypothetical protein
MGMSGQRLKRQGWLAENGVGLVTKLFRAGAQHAMRHVVQKIRRHVEFFCIASACRSFFPRFGGACCAPPFTSRLVGLGDHRIHEYEHPHGGARAHKRRRERLE